MIATPDFDIGPQDALSLLLPNLPHMHYLLWGGGAAGIVNPINPLLRAPQIAEIFQAAGSRLLVRLVEQVLGQFTIRREVIVD